MSALQHSEEVQARLLQAYEALHKFMSFTEKEKIPAEQWQKLEFVSSVFNQASEEDFIAAHKGNIPQHIFEEWGDDGWGKTVVFSTPGETHANIDKMFQALDVLDTVWKDKHNKFRGLAKIAKNELESYYKNVDVLAKHAPDRLALDKNSNSVKGQTTTLNKELADTVAAVELLMKKSNEMDISNKDQKKIKDLRNALVGIQFHTKENGHPGYDFVASTEEAGFQDFSTEYTRWQKVEKMFEGLDVIGLIADDNSTVSDTAKDAKEKLTEYFSKANYIKDHDRNKSFPEKELGILGKDLEIMLKPFLAEFGDRIPKSEDMYSDYHTFLYDLYDMQQDQGYHPLLRYYQDSDLQYFVPEAEYLKKAEACLHDVLTAIKSVDNEQASTASVNTRKLAETFEKTLKLIDLPTLIATHENNEHTNSPIGQENSGAKEVVSKDIRR